MWLEIGWLFCNLFQVPELWSDFRGFLGTNSFPDLGNLNDSVAGVPWVQGNPFSGQQCGKKVKGPASPQLWPVPWRCQHGTCLEVFHVYEGLSHTLICFGFYSCYMKQGGHTETSYSPFYRVGLNRISNLTDFPNSLSDWVVKQGEVCNPLWKAVRPNGRWTGQ